MSFLYTHGRDLATQLELVIEQVCTNVVGWLFGWLVRDVREEGCEFSENFEGKRMTKSRAGVETQLRDVC